MKKNATFSLVLFSFDFGLTLIVILRTLYYIFSKQYNFSVSKGYLVLNTSERFPGIEDFFSFQGMLANQRPKVICQVSSHDSKGFVSAAATSHGSDVHKIYIIVIISDCYAATNAFTTSFIWLKGEIKSLLFIIQTSSIIIKQENQ